MREVGALRVTVEPFAIWRKDDKTPVLQKFVEMIRSHFDEVARH